MEKINSPVDRMCMIAAFVVSWSCSAVYKNRRPFGAVLGETFDFVSDEGWKCYAEIVSGSNEYTLHICVLGGEGRRCFDCFWKYLGVRREQ